MLRLNTDEFENVIIYKSLTDSSYLGTIIDAINPDHFKDKNIKKIFSIIKDFHTRRNTVPTVTEIKSYLNSSEEKEAFKTVVLKFSSMDKSFNGDELIENTERYIKERAIWQSMLEISDDVTSGKIDASAILDRFEKSCNINLKTDVGLDLIKDFNKVVKDISTDQPVIPTGFKFLDDLLGGGFQRNGRAIYVFVGETNVGKSIYLGNIATNIANQGKTVLLISLEMSEMMYAKRLSSSLTKIPMRDLRGQIGNLTASIDQYSKNNPNNRIIIKEFPPSTVTPASLQAYVKSVVAAGIHIDAIVIDYVNLLKGPSDEQSYERVKAITEQVRAMSYIFECPIITASQLNRSGYGVDKPGLEMISESTGLAATADFIAAITQNDEDREINISRLHVLKNRFGPNFGMTCVKINYPTLTISEDETLNEECDLSSSNNTLMKLSSS